MKGFTLIELTVALSIMTILVAMLLPRVAQLQRAARTGNLKGLHGSVSAASLLVHAAALTRNGQPDTAACVAGSGTVRANNQLVGPGTVCTKAGLIHTLNAYPASTPLGTAGIVSAAGLSETFTPNKTELKARGYDVRVEGGVTTFAHANADDPAACSFTYTQATNAGSASVISTPVVHGC